MPRCQAALLMMSVLLTASGLWAQESEHAQQADVDLQARAASALQAAEHAQHTDLLARLSYQSSAVVRRDDVRQVCVAVSRDGEYRMVRSADNAPTLRIQGKMPKEQFEQLTKLLTSPAFRALSGNHGGLIRQDAESFAAEILRPEREHADGTRLWIEGDAWRLQWLNADDASPFPGSIAKVVDWLEHFEPKGKPFVYAEYPDVCPSVGLRFVQPTVAANQQP